MLNIKLNMKELKEVKGGMYLFHRHRQSASTDFLKDEEPGQQDMLYQKIVNFFKMNFH